MPNPSDYDNEDDFVSACIAQRQDEHPEEDTDQSAAVCYSMWSDKAAPAVIHKTTVLKSGGKVDDEKGIEFVLSDASPDRYGDTIDVNGWVLDNFQKNPIALFNHRSDFPIGRWHNLGVRENGLRGFLRIAPAGISERIDEIRKLVEADILRAVSVGFLPIESQARRSARNDYLGESYMKQELVETSLVSVPAHPNALAVAKSLKISGDMMDMVFSKNATETFRHGGDNDTITWQGRKIPVKRFIRDTWRGQPIHHYD